LFWLRRREPGLHSAPDDAAALNEWNLIFGSKWEEWKGDRKLPASAVCARLYTISDGHQLLPGMQWEFMYVSMAAAVIMPSNQKGGDFNERFFFAIAFK
jgi:hypothetical protein